MVSLILMSKITVLIITFNSSSYILDCIVSINKYYEKEVGFEGIVIGTHLKAMFVKESEEVLPVLSEIIMDEISQDALPISEVQSSTEETLNL